MNFTFSLIPEEQCSTLTALQLEQNLHIDKIDDKIPKKSCQKRKQKIHNPYKWKSVQNSKYINFIKTRMHLMNLSVAERKKIKINVIMSNYIKTRNPQQCRSHHQKMMIKYGTLQNIIAFYPNDCKDNKKSEISEEISEAQILHAEMKNIIDDHKEYSSEPFWYQYLDLYSCHQSQEFLHIEDEQ